ncbi:MAG: aminopeptidase N [Gammaproteobacteria bacterium AqS3]|nr:aminopeptidase N [Gammaproteobacteria bacterium AqS3]
MAEAADTTVYLKDYRPYPRTLERTELEIDLHLDAPAEVRTRLHFAAGEPGELVLDGEDLDTLGLFWGDGSPLEEGADYRIDGARLHLLRPPAEAFTLKTHVRIDPHGNTRLEGLYRTSGLFCTQCEAEGFRRITWYPDRPDVLSRFLVRLSAPRAECPVLLANGNCIETGVETGIETGEEGQRHWALWDDPFPKPSYLFALIGGDLTWIERIFETCSGRPVQLRIYAAAQHLERLDFAMDALVRSMRWDEQNYGREYDLDVFNVVAVDDFNMGAMENKGLNIFNTACLVADASVQTDQAFANVEAIVAHEYFHNWSGNRVTCRDWFQLSLKEGFTVFRENHFVADARDADTERIAVVRMLRSIQFPEDGSPTAHPVQPQSYREISNFYTATVYEKGAEVVGMLRTLMGAEAFRRGCDAYFAAHDGRAVCIEDFLEAMQPFAPELDFEHFARWYFQSGTPQIDVEEDYDAEQGVYTLTLHQHTPPTRLQKHPEPLLIPVRMALLDAEGDSAGAPLPLHSDDIAGGVGEGGGADGQGGATETVLRFNRERQSWRFEGVHRRPMASLLRGFSAPVRRIDTPAPDELQRRAQIDTDPFNRWDALQQLGVLAIADADAHADTLIEAVASALECSAQEPARGAQALSFPDMAQLIELSDAAEPQKIALERSRLLGRLADALRGRLTEVWEHLRGGVLKDASYSPDWRQATARLLSNRCLELLCLDGNADWCELAERQVIEGANMTDLSAGMTALLLSRAGTERARSHLEELRRSRADEPLVLDAWLRWQAASEHLGDLDNIRRLQGDERLAGGNPNAVRALIGSFAQNPHHFHRSDGAGYIFLADFLGELDRANPQLAARLAQPLVRYRRLAPALQQGCRRALQNLKTRGDDLSADLSEVIDLGLEG